MAKKRRQPVPATFKVGDRVRVKHGIRDTDFPSTAVKRSSSQWLTCAQRVRPVQVLRSRTGGQAQEGTHPEVDGGPPKADRIPY